MPSGRVVVGQRRRRDAGLADAKVDERPSAEEKSCLFSADVSALKTVAYETGGGDGGGCGGRAHGVTATGLYFTGYYYYPRHRTGQSTVGRFQDFDGTILIQQGKTCAEH